ncbi:hypothetical protein BH10BDE1_BH10BDE1_33370 [soil metagenome]
MTSRRTRSPNDFTEIMAKFLADHNKVIDGLDFSKKERGPELRKPIRDSRTHSAPEIAKIAGKLGFELPPSHAKFLREFGSFWLYDFEIYPTGNLAKEIKDFKSWIKEDPLTVKSKNTEAEPETIQSSDLLPFAGFDLDKYLIHIETKKVYFWNHEEWSQLQFIGTFEAWLSRFLTERLQGVKSYYKK